MLYAEENSCPICPTTCQFRGLFTEQRAWRLALGARNPHKTEDLVYEDLS
jgi:hypothetical protein